MGNIPGMKKPDIHALPQIKDAFPAHAGVIPTTRPARSCAMSFPRTRGGDPGEIQAKTGLGKLSPHTRG